MANDFSGRIWKIDTGATTPFGSLNVKIKGGSWTGMTATGQTFIITDSAGRTYTWTATASTLDAGGVSFDELGWLSGPLTFSGTFTGEVLLFLAGGK